MSSASEGSTPQPDPEGAQDGAAPGDGKRPSDGGPADHAPGQDAATQTPPPEGVTGDPLAPPMPDARDRWGDLPLHVRDIFRADGGGDFPPRYRDWIDAYHKRLNKSR